MPSRLAPEHTIMVAAVCLRRGDLMPLEVAYTDSNTPPRWATVRAITNSLTPGVVIVRLNRETRGGRVVDLCDLRLPPGCERAGCQTFTAPDHLLIEANITDREDIF